MEPDRVVVEGLAVVMWSSGRAGTSAEVVDVGVIDRMLTRGTTGSTTGQQLALLAPPPTPSRFVRATTDFAVRKPS